MAGPFARVVAQVLVLGISILSRALPAAYAAALRNAQKSGGGAAAAGGGSSILGKARMKRDEALMILNLSEKDCSPEAIRRQFDKYFAANAVEKGGSFYLQSKIYRAKELLDEFEKEKRTEEKAEAEEAKTSSSSSQQGNGEGIDSNSRNEQQQR